MTSQPQQMAQGGAAVSVMLQQDFCSWDSQGLHTQQVRARTQAGRRALGPVKL